MALLHRDRTATTTDDTVAGTATTSRPAWPNQEAERPVVVKKGSFGSTLRAVLATAIVVGIVLIAAANTDQVDVDMLFETYDVSLAALVGGSAAAGFLVGLLLGWRGRRRRHAAA